MRVGYCNAFAFSRSNSALGSTMGFSVETLGFYALFIPLMSALGYDRLVTA